MNNSSIVLEQEPVLDLTSQYQVREGKLTRILEAVAELRKTKCWSVLKTEVFDDLAAKFERELLSEAKKDQPDPLKLNRTAGQLTWAARYSNLDKFEEPYRTELAGIKKKLHG